MTDTSLTPAEHAVQIPGVRATRLGLEIDEDLTPESARTVFACLEHITGCSNWLWGDALAFADRKWGNQFVDSKYKTAAEATGQAIMTLKNAKFVAERIPMARRRAELTFTHHAEVAFGFRATAEQDQWLDRAVAENWSVIQLRRDIRLSKKEIFEERNHDRGMYKACAAYLTLVGWLRNEKLEKWAEEQVAVWVNDLTVIEEFRQRLLEIQSR